MVASGDKITTSVPTDLQHLTLTQLSTTALTTPILPSCPQIAPDLVARWISSASSADEAVLVLTALARDVSVCPCIQTLCSHFVAKMGFMEMLKVPQSDSQTEAILLAFFRLVSFDRETYGGMVDKEVISSLMAHDMAKQLLYKVFEMTKCDEQLEYRESERVLALARDLLPTTQIQVAVSDLNSLNTPIGSSLIPRLGGPSPVASDYVETDTSIEIMNELGQALSTSAPILLSGPSGSGKTFYVNEIARNLSKLDNMVRIHLGDQTDSKLLIGAYTTGSKPGSFEWRDGVLTTAIKEGRWVLVEDIDRAPTDVVSVLLSLLEKRELVIPSRDEVIKAHAGFRLVGTMRKKIGAHTNEIIGLRLWQQVELPELQAHEIVTIIQERYHVISAMAESFQNTFAAIVALYGSSSFVSLTKSAVSRVVSLNDLIKLCNRVSSMISRLGYTSPKDPLPNHVYEFIFLEALDCFAGFLSNSEARNRAAHVIGECLGMSAPKVDVLLGRVPAYQDSVESLEVGRSVLTKQVSGVKKKSNSLFANTNHAAKLMEQICVAISSTEPLLLVGETGTGKTTVVQNVAQLMNKKLTVVNVSQQTEAGDLLGGFKPVDVSMIAVPLMDEFQEVFSATFSAKKNVEFMKLLSRAFNIRHWKNCIRLWREAVKLSAGRLKESESGKRRKLTDKETVSLQAQWDQFQANLTAFEIQYKQIQSSFVFQFIEGSIVQAVRKGEWVLLDEINLASPDTLEAISDLLSEPRTLLLSEKGDAETIVAHPDFRLFACMNPATDVGKRDLPLGLRSRFTELYVSSPDENFDDLLKIIDRYIGHLCVSDSTIGIHNDVADLYLTAKKLSAENKIVDGAGQKPHFSIRTLSRTLVYVSQIAHLFGPRGLRRSLYEGFCMSFLTLLDAASETALHEVIKKYTVNKLKDQKSIMSAKTKAPSDKHVAFEHYWLEPGPLAPFDDDKYVMTPFVTKNLLNLVRATSGKSSVLIQGPTSAGKTSMIRYLAQKTGHEFVRINNHEHTDLQEYLGTYVADSEGKLKFKEGVLVQALRRGAWIVLDELNLAPTDVLEALNRLLDDNRELLIPETQEVVRPHPQFRLFATQNPPGLYGGRKQLSRAFRNRFLELHFGDIPENELEHILHKRALIAPSQAAKIVNVYRELSLVRQASRVFEQNAFATLRDLFRWAGRNCDNNEELAMNGFLLLGERVRNPEEREVVKKAIEKVMKVKLDERQLYDHVSVPGVDGESSVVMTNGLRRLVYLVQEAIKHKEPILLVGETGCGKTTVCQLLAEAREKELHIVNAHQNMETGDIIGSFRPVRNRSDLEARFRAALVEALGEEGNGLTNAELDAQYLAQLKKDPQSFSEEVRLAVIQTRAAQKTLFTWSDGSLIQALKQGDFFLLDEISLADDSVLERLNSVLEPERTLLLAEKGSDASEASVTALPDFQFFATMNPGGDYGKKELSLALRNRFTEIWVPSMEDFADVETIVSSRLSEDKKYLSKVVTDFSKWFAIKYSGSTTSGIISLRNLLAWTEFINKFEGEHEVALLHGALMVFIDALGTGQTSYLTNLEAEKRECISKLQSLLKGKKKLLKIYDETPEIEDSSQSLQIGHFGVSKESSDVSSSAVSKATFNLSAPTTRLNAMRVLRSLQVSKPILLEGSPGVGKTSLITSIAQLLGKPLTRINLSEQTDLIDLFGSDAPAEDSEAGTFVWRDAPFLRAMQAGEWVLLDEMNLASQSVLEGLNACLDHRGQTYIPELDKFFTCAPGFTVFAAQNPQHQGGGRKGLPKSFLNRFTVVYVDALDKEDLFQIAQYLYPGVDYSERMIQFISQLDKEVQSGKFGAKGAPWEFNMRDTMRWMSLVKQDENGNPGAFLNLIAGDRFRTTADRQQLEELYKSVFDGQASQSREYCVTVQNSEQVRCGRASLARNQLIQPAYSSAPLSFLHCNSSPSETLIRAINHSWPVILAGPSCSGKTSLIRLMASVAGATLDEIALNADVDSVDLVGGYEQVDNRQKREQIDKKVGLVFAEWARRELARDNQAGLAKALAHKADTSMDADLQIQIQHLYDDLDALSKSKNASDAVSFQWIDGILVNAVSQGHWLVLDNANLCSASVLDRLNSLLEPNGTLILNESALEDGSPRVISPHKNFRIFLTVNPKYGELSRAMRNRAVEIFVDELEVRMSDFDRVRIAETAGGAPIKQSNALTWRRAVTSVEGGLETGSGNSEVVSGTALKYLSWPLASSDFAGLLASTDAPALAKEAAQIVMSLCSEIGIDRYISLLEQTPSYDHVTPVDAFVDPSLDPDLVRLGELSPILAVMVRFSKTTSNLALAASNGENNKASQLTYIEKSAAAVAGRRMKDAAAPGLYQLLSGAVEVVRAVLDKVLAGGVVETEVYTHLLSLLTLADQIYINTSVQSPVESQFHVYADWFETWTVESRGIEFNALQKALALFDSQIQLSRGLVMRHIWETLCPSVPSTLAGWLTFEKVAALCDRFDRVCAQMPVSSLDTVLSVKSQFAGFLAAAVDNSVSEEFFSTLIQTVDSMDQEENTRDHPYQSLFEDLATTFELSNVHHANLSFYACLPTREESPLEKLTKHGNGFELTSADHLAGEYVSAAQNFGNTKNGAVEQSRGDYAYLGKILAADNSAILADKLPDFVSVLKSTLSDLEEVGSAVTGAAVSALDQCMSHLNTVPALLSEQTVSSVGTAYIAVFKAALDLYVPNLPYDPAIKEYVDYDMQTRVDELHRLSHNVDQKMKQVFFGTPVEEYTSSTLLFKPRVYRDSSTSIDLMIREWNQFMVVLDQVVDKVSANSDPESLLLELDLFQKNTQQFLVRLKASYPRFSDLCAILDRFVSGFRLGVFMMQSALSSEPVSEWTSDALTLSSSVALSATLDSLVKFCNDKSVEDLSVEKTLSFVMDVVSKQGNSDKALVAYCCTTVFARWTLRRLRMEEQAAIESSGFSTNLDETAEEEFAKLFPDYEIHLDEAGNVIKPKVTKQDVDYSGWLKSYERVFGGVEEPLSHVILKGAGLAGHGHVSHVMPTLLQAHVTVLDTDCIEVAESSPSFDFYRQHSAAETQKCVNVATKLLKFVSGLLTKWPEHDTLQQIAFQCNELLAFSVVTPVARLLAKVEQIYTFLHEWEKLASRDVSVREYIDIFTTLIVSWRRLELAMWPKLFDFEEEAQKDGLGQWWFNVYEAVVVVCRDNSELSRDDVTQLVQTLNLFLSQSTIGQYGFRLELLEAVLKHIGSMEESVSVAQVTVALKAFLVYYRMFVPSITAHVAARKKTLQKDMQEVILLASWKDTNVHALKESARKSHRKLFKVVKKYRTLLCEPVKSVLEGGMQESGVVSSVQGVTVPAVADLSELLALYTPSFVPDVQKTLSILSKRISHLDQIESVSLMDIVSDILEESARLKKATPNHATEDNKKEIGALRVEKQRFLSETLKELRAHGFKGRITQETLESQSSLSSVLGNIVVSSKRDQSYFMRLVDSFSKLRSACANPAGDVPLHDISVAAAMAENILRMCIKENNVIGQVEQAAGSMSDLCRQLESVSLDVSVSFVDGQAVVRFMQGLKTVIRVIVESASNVLRLDGKLGSAVAQVTTLCNDFDAKFDTLLVSFNSVKHLMDWKKPSGETHQLVCDIQSAVETFQSKLDAVADKNQCFRYASRLVSSFVALEHVSTGDLTKDEVQTLDSVDKLCKTILVSVQGVIKRVSEDVGEDDESDNVSFSRDYQLLMNLAQLLHSERILTETRSTISSVSHSASGAAALGVLRAYIEQYVFMCNLVVSKASLQFADLTKGGFLLCKALYNLATTGFCSPEEEQDQEQDSNATASGTGLGDGSGAQDHSGDVGEDENLDDYMEQENEDQEDKEDDEDDDAVSVEGDMAGKSENAKDEEEGEDKDGDEEEEEEEIDDETGKLDDLDPNAMDDKMWNDDEEVQDEKEKDGDVDGDDKDDGGEEGKQDDGKQQGEEGEAETKEGEEEEGEGDEGEKMDDKEGDEDGDDNEDDSDGESVDAQEDDVRNKQDGEELDPHLDESEVLELPDDMNLDGLDEDKEEGEDEFDDGLDKDMSDDEDEEDVEMEDLEAGEEDPEEGAEEQEVDEGSGETNEDVEDADEKDPEEQDNVKEDAEEENQMDVDQDDNETGKQSEDAPELEMEGLHGQDDAGEQDDNDESAVKQESGEKGSGQDADSKEEEEDVGGGGDAGAKEKAEEEDEDKAKEEGDAPEEDSRVDQMKQLGDALKEFHKKKEEIQNSSNDAQDDVDSANVDPQEFEHVDGPDSKHDTQAMGAADRDVKQEIDDDMAMDDEQEVKPERRNVKEEEPESDLKPEEGVEEEEEEGGAPEGAASKTAVEGEAESDDEDAASKVQGEMMDVDSEEELDEVEDEIEELSIDETALSLSESRDKWKTYQSSVADLATTLCEQLRLILEPTLATKMRGDFKTGKRLNMKRIIPYIASSFKKDKIWMRRTKPSKRQYQIMISVDDSKSMNESPQCVELAFQSIALISKALTQLESGQLAVMKFGQDAQLVHPFEKTFSDESGGELVSKFSFAQDQTNVQKLVQNSIDIFQQQKLGGAELWQLQIIISDGICENHEVLRQLVRHARELKIMLVFVVIDALAAASGQSSITDIKQAKYISQDDGQMVLKMEKYLDTFPFEFYVIVRDIKELPSVLSSVLRQFYSEVAEMS
ncbi:Midasin [Yarrowia sp. C11]|nr:Midasin [Yarrowia sp. E02]KAG5373005.1 Midasin [Yarrowia sp. C11]